MIEIKGLGKSYGPKKVLEKVNLTVPDASVFGLVGINGAGKTTLLRMMADVLRPDEGTVEYDGENIAGAAVLLEDDDQWDDTPPAYYVHNLVGSLDSRGAGGAILDFVEQMAVRHHKKYVRLDCSIDNPELNTYYEKRGYHLAGQCQEGPYIGNRRQKAVEQS